MYPERPPPPRRLFGAAARMLPAPFVPRQALRSNPASVVLGPRHVVKKGKTPVLLREDAKTLFTSIGSERLIDLRDRALIATMLFSFARVGAVVRMTRSDYVSRGKTDWLRLREKGGKHHEVPAHHQTVEYLDAYLEAGDIDDGRRAALPVSRPLGRPHGSRAPLQQRASALQAPLSRCRHRR